MAATLRWSPCGENVDLFLCDAAFGQSQSQLIVIPSTVTLSEGPNMALEHGATFKTGQRQTQAHNTFSKHRQ